MPVFFFVYITHAVMWQEKARRDQKPSREPLPQRGDIFLCFMPHFAEEPQHYDEQTGVAQITGTVCRTLFLLIYLVETSYHCLLYQSRGGKLLRIAHPE
jgi:hypothetical protein